MRIFLAGATGAIGKRLVPLLLDAGYSVIGTTRSTAKADGLRAAGAEPVVVDVFDAAALSAAVLQARPDVVIHQLTDLPPGLDPKQMTAGTQRNARVRSEGTQNLVTAMLEAKVRRLVAQSMPGCTRRGRNRIPRMIGSILRLRGPDRSLWQASQRWSGWRHPLRQSMASSFVTGISMDPGPEPPPRKHRRSTLTQQPRPRSCRSRGLIAVSTTLPNQTDTSPRKRHGASSALMRPSG